MPVIGTLLRAQMRNGFLVAFGDPYPNLCQLPPERAYQGQIVGIWQVPPSDHEPAQIDVLAVPAEIWKAFVSVIRGESVESVQAALEAESVAARAGKKILPSAMRLSFLLEEGPCAFYESSLTMHQALIHLMDRNVIAENAYEDEDDAEDDGADDTASATNGAAPAPAAAQPSA